MDRFYIAEVEYFCGCLTLKVGTIFISLLAAGSGGLGVAAFIMYGLAEQSILSSFLPKAVSRTLIRIFMLVFGITSSLLTLAGCLILLGWIRDGYKIISCGVFMLLCMCCVAVIAVIGVPVSCFFSTNLCLIRDISIPVLSFCFLFVTLLLQMWVYFSVVVYSYVVKIKYL